MTGHHRGALSAGQVGNPRGFRPLVSLLVLVQFEGSGAHDLPVGPRSECAAASSTAAAATARASVIPVAVGPVVSLIDV
jgi:hypothetical protein